MLYDRAIDVLLFTWNVEGHKPLSRDEAIPQLAFVAYKMMASGVQTISMPGLDELLREGRSTLRDVLGFVTYSPGDFVERVEDRSSLLSFTGHIEEGGRVVPVYKFKHRTFQEYLAAYAICAGYLPHDDEDTPLGELTEQFVVDPYWHEALSLLAVLAGRRASEVLNAVVRSLQPRPPLQSREEELEQRNEFNAACISLIIEALADDVMLSPELATELIDLVIQECDETQHSLNGVMDSKFGELFKGRLVRAWSSARGAANIYLLTTGACDLWVLASLKKRSAPLDLQTELQELLKLLDPREGEMSKALFAVGAMHFAFERLSRIRMSTSVDEVGAETVREELGQRLVELCRSDSPKLLFPAMWALAWLLDSWEPPLDTSVELVMLAYSAWRTLKGPMRRYGAWALSRVPIVDVARVPLGEGFGDDGRFVVAQLRRRGLPQHETREIVMAAVVVSYYLGLGALVSEEELGLVMEHPHVPERVQESLLKMVSAIQQSERDHEGSDIPPVSPESG